MSHTGIVDHTHINRVLKADDIIRTSKRNLKSHEHLFVYPDEYKVYVGEHTESNYPIIKVKGHDFDLGLVKVNLNKFGTLFFERFPGFRKVNFHNILIAGGSVSQIIIGKSKYIDDVDVFVYGLNEREATEKINEIIRDYGFKPGTVFAKNKNCLTCSASDAKIQFIFRLYNSISEILHSFDIGSSAIGFDGQAVYTTGLGNLAYTAGVNVIDLRRHSPTYEGRLAKYAERGFHIIAPNLNIPAAKGCGRYYLSLNKGRLRLTYPSIENDVITCEYINGNEYDGETYDDVWNAWNKNLYYIMLNQPNALISKGDSVKDLSFDEEYIIERYKDRMADLYRNARSSIKIRAFKAINPEKDAEWFVKTVLADNKKLFDMYVEKRILDIKIGLSDGNPTKFNWVKLDAEAPLTSAICATPTDPKVWYGEYYAEI